MAQNSIFDGAIERPVPEIHDYNPIPNRGHIRNQTERVAFLEGL